MREDYQAEIPLTTRIRDSILPPAAGKPRLTKAQRNLLTGAFAGVVLLALAGGGFYYWAGTEDRAEAAFQQGMRLAAAGKTQEAIATFDGVIATLGSHSKAYLERGNAKRILRQMDGALADYEQAAALDPSLADALTARSMIFKDRGELDKAVTELGRSIKIQPTMDAYFQRGQIEDSLGRHREAIEDYTLAIDRYPSAPFVYLARSAAKKALGDEAGALDDRQAGNALLNKLRR